MGSVMKLNILQFYPRVMNLYGDRGDVMALVYRARKRGIEVDVINVEIGSDVNLEDADIIFIGGAQDREQQMIYKDFIGRAREVTRAIETGKVCLAICGGYQLLGKYFDPVSGDRIEGIGALDLYTKGGSKRLIGNVVSESTIAQGETYVGFENHSGRTYLNKDNKEIKSLGKVITGFGNNGEDKSEGAVYKNTYGTYLHGAFLPKPGQPQGIPAARG